MEIELANLLLGQFSFVGVIVAWPLHLLQGVRDDGADFASWDASWDHL